MILAYTLVIPSVDAQTQSFPDRQLIIVGGDNNYPPYEYIDENGEAAGFNIEIMRSISEVMGFDAEFRLMTWNESITSFRGGDIHVLPMFQSAERSLYYNFTERFRTIYHLLFIRAGNPGYTSLDNLDGKSVIVEEGTYAHEELLRDPRGAMIIPVASEADAIRLLASGEHDCALVTRIGGYFAINQYDLNNIVSGSPPLMTSDYCFAIAKGDSILLAQINQGLRIIQATDRFDDIYDRWIGQIEPHNHSFHEILRDAIWVLLPLLVLTLFAFGWSWLLRSQVSNRTRELVRVNRALKTMSECNQAIVQAKSEHELLDTLCGIMTHVGGYRIAWIGIVEKGEHEHVRLASISGVEKKSFEHMIAFDTSVPDDLKPCTRSITTGKPVIVSDIFEDPRYVPWRELAVKNGFTSVISLPLKRRDGIFGCINLYSPDKDSFDTVELNLLDELSEDISFGIISLITLSERDIAVRSMLESQKRMSTIFYKSPFGHVMCRFNDLVIVELNEAFLNISGFSRDEVMGKSVYDFIEKDSGNMMPIFTQNENVYDKEIQFVRKNGEIGYGLLSMEAFKISDDKFTVVFLNDITPRKLAEQRVLHLNDVLRGIRNVNQLITREHDRTLIVQKACDLLVEARGFQSVCIGLFDTTGESVDLIAGAGRKLTIMKEMLSQNLLTDCVREVMEDADLVVRYPGDSACIDCFGTNDTSWRDAVIVRIGHEQKVFGFMMTAMPPGMGDDPEEHDLLREVAGDIAFALYSIEIESERNHAMKEIESLAKFPSENPNPVMRLTVDGDVLYANDAAKVLLAEYQSRPGIKAPSHLLELVTPIVESGKPDSIDMKWDEYTYIFGVSPVLQEGYVNLYGRNISDRIHLEEQLRQSQKMEAVGRLAGGVAHDFNNMLSVIMGYAELGIEMTDDNESVTPLLREIHSAGERAASLTRQLLAFSRKQVMRMDVFNFNKIITGMRDMLERLIGEDIDLVFALSDNLGNVKADPGQIEQVIMNLAVNSRDAMPTGGKLTVETCNVELDEEYARSHVAVTPGPYVMLAVSDTGAGMDENVLSRLFEPFFTTKQDSSGTGLGLATSYGIVKQSGGNIWVYSEVGKGTTFKVYLPRIYEPSQIHRSIVRPKPVNGTETILVVEDEDSVRMLAQRILEGFGYTVLTASNASEVDAVCSQYAKPIQLVLTDVVMPGVSGRVMAENLKKTYPEIGILYMSGYTDNAIVHHGILEPGIHFIGKPFSSSDLVHKVREVLNERKL